MTDTTLEEPGADTITEFRIIDNIKPKSLYRNPYIIKKERQQNPNYSVLTPNVQPIYSSLDGCMDISDIVSLGKLKSVRSKVVPTRTLHFVSYKADNRLGGGKPRKGWGQYGWETRNLIDIRWGLDEDGVISVVQNFVNNYNDFILSKPFIKGLYPYSVQQVPILTTAGMFIATASLRNRTDGRDSIDWMTELYHAYSCL